MGAHAHTATASSASSLNRLAAVATLHCLTGCAIGEVLGMVIGTALGWSNAATIALAVLLAFVFGYSLTMLPLLRAGLALAAALPIAFAADSFSIAVMELVDNGVMLAVPGAMDAPLSNPLFWGALALAFAIAYVAAFPVNRYLIARGRGHAVVHRYHGHGADGGHGAGGAVHGHHGHAAEARRAAREERAAAGPAPGSPRRLIAFGVAAMSLTIGVATGGALVVESGDHGEAGTAAERAAGGHADEAGGGSAELSGLAVARDGYQLVVPDTRLAAGRPTRFAFSVVAGARPVREFDEEGGVRMHLIVVRRDLTGYQHLHPSLQPDGSWQTDLSLAAAGVYRAYADFEREGEKTVLATDLFVPGEFAPSPLPEARDTVEVAGYRVELLAEARAGAETTLAYRITKRGRPVDVEPYLGAAGHLVALRDGDLAYLHVHPLTEQRGEVGFAATFPTAGDYRLFLQFKDAGRVHTAPLTVSVGRGR